MQLESALASIKDIINEKEKVTFMQLDQIQQLYSLLCKRINVEPHFKRNQVEEQLDFIKKEIETIQEIIKLSNEMIANDTRSDIAECGSGKSGKPRKYIS